MGEWVRYVNAYREIAQLAGEGRSRRLMAVPGAGPVLASAMVASVPKE